MHVWLSKPQNYFQPHSVVSGVCQLSDSKALEEQKSKIFLKASFLTLFVYKS